MLVGSLTTISSRINTVHLVIESLYNQTKKLDCVYLFISKEPYLLDEGIKEIPEELKKYMANKFLIIEYTENEGAYRKFIPIIQKFYKRNDVIITFFDDDWIYPKMLIEKMYETYQRFTSCFITVNASNLFYDKNGYVDIKDNKYFKDKTFYEPNTPRIDLWTNNGYGVMFKSNLIQDEELFDSKKYLEITPVKDEPWLNAILKKNKIYIVVVDNKYQDPGKKEPLGTKWHLTEGRYKLIQDTQKVTLASTMKYTPNQYNNILIRLKEYYKI